MVVYSVQGCRADLAAICAGSLGAARRADRLEIDFNPYHATYYLSQMTIVPTGDGAMAPWRKSVFMAMARNAASPVSYFNLPPERVVSLGAQVRF